MVSDETLSVHIIYTRPQLLLTNRIYWTGTVQSNRKNVPRQVIPSSTSLAPGSFCVATTKMSMGAGKTEELVAVWWHDCQVVLAMSTMCSTSVTIVMKQPKGYHEKRPLSCPTMIDDYNMYMDGVDLTDQHLSYY